MLRAFNTAEAEDAVELLLACCASRAWAEKLVSGRPYGTVAALKAAALTGFDELDEPELAVAHAAHPQIGGPIQKLSGGPIQKQSGGPTQKPGGSSVQHSGRGVQDRSARPETAGRSTEAAWSRGEQSRAMTADTGVRARIAEVNAAYERRFGRVFLICATGLTGEEILAEALRRLENDDRTEHRESVAELRKIVALRLDKLFDGKTFRGGAVNGRGSNGGAVRP